MLIGTLCTPDDTGRSTGGVETGVGFVTFVRRTEMTMGFGILFCSMGKNDLQLAIDPTPS
jgi:hypothetical protein